MPKSTTYTVIYIDRTSPKASHSPVLDYETFTDLKSLEACVIGLNADGTQYTVVTGDILEVVIDTSPRVTIGAAAPVEKKPRAKRRTREQMQADAVTKAAKKKTEVKVAS